MLQENIINKVWNKGLTKETDVRVKTGSEKMKGRKTGRVPKTAFKKGYKSWNTGLKGKGICKAWNKNLTKETDERVKRNATKRKKYCEENKDLILQINHNRCRTRGWKLSQKTIDKMKGNQNAKGQTMSSEGRIKWLLKMKGKKSPRKDAILTQETKDKISKNRTGIPVSIQTRKKNSIASKKNWENPEYRKKVLAVRSPNKAEKVLQEILKNMNLNSYIYVGDGKVRIGRKIPDFINEKEKKIIELFGERYHEKIEEIERKEYFKERGYNTLIIWSIDLFKNREKMKNNIIEFSSA